VAGMRDAAIKSRGTGGLGIQSHDATMDYMCHDVCMPQTAWSCSLPSKDG